MKYKRQLAALLLSVTLLTGMAVPSFAEPETDDSAVTTTQTTDDSTSDGTQTSTNQTDTDSDTDNDANTDADAAEPDNTQADDAAVEEEETDDKSPVITIDAKASILVNAETGEIIHAENEKEKEYPASTTKVMTALLVLEKCSLSDVVTMQESDFIDVNNGASNAGLKVGEQITVENLLYCLLLPSGNEAANALARVTGGSVDEFVQMMNDRAKELGCVNTHFANPNGLHDDNHYTCAYDLYLIAQQAMQNSTFTTIVNTAQKKLPATNMNAERIIYTTNHLILSSYSSIYYDNCYGIKTGHTSQAGYCLVSYAKQSGYTYYSVILGANAGSGEYAGSFTETKRLFEWAFDNFHMRTATQAGSAVTECSVRLGRGTDHVTLVTSDDVSVLIPSGADTSDLDVEISTEDSYDAPIARGDKLGTVTYSYQGMECATADLVALSEVQRSPILYTLDCIAKFLRLTAVRAIVAIVVIIFLLYMILSFIAGRNRRINRKKKRTAQKRRNNRR
ncbi:MAG: D-alanyl-D-alanine carboxypeptidase [Clostridia bacterium]|nr:D-alanyl-D-alanine carboxypeptidase [Clostridia bacterium]